MIKYWDSNFKQRPRCVEINVKFNLADGWKFVGMSERVRFCSARAQLVHSTTPQHTANPHPHTHTRTKKQHITRIHTHTRTDAQTHAHTHTEATHTHACMHACTHAHTHAHTFCWGTSTGRTRRAHDNKSTAGPARHTRGMQDMANERTNERAQRPNEPNFSRSTALESAFSAAGIHLSHKKMNNG